MKRIILFLTLVSTTPTNAALIGLSYNTDSLYSIDHLTGTAIYLSSVSSLESGFSTDVRISGLSFLDGNLYASDILLLGASFAENTVGIVEGTTGGFLSTTFQFGPNWQALASNEAAGLLYTVDFDDNNKLKSITPDGTVTSIGSGAGVFVHGMAYDDTNNILYATSTSDLYTIDTALGTSTLIGTTGLFTIDTGLAFDEVTQSLYMVYSPVSSQEVATLYSVNVNTGTATLIGGTGISGIDGLAWVEDVSEVPLPAAIWLFGSGLISLIVVARRKKA